MDEDIGELENETIFEPGEDDVQPDEHKAMQMGKGLDNDLRDPWFHTDEGKTWLAEHGGGEG
jgi:hypothetical protein